MKTGAVTKIAASALVLGTVLVSCGPNATQSGVASVSATPKLVKLAATNYAKADKALSEGDFASAIVAAEAAVQGSPRDPAYRRLLGQAYLAGGRFSSAEAAFTDTLTLDPNNSRAALSLALARIALGQPRMALATLDRAEIAVADRGLAHALAGDLEGALALLEPAARAEDADPKTRQNLALAYALAERWSDARAVAAQDVSADQLDRTMAGWAAFARPQYSWDQVANLLGVKPVFDRGQPGHLALAPAPAAQPSAEQLAAADLPEPVEADPVADEPAEAAPVEVAEAAVAEPALAPVEPASTPAIARVAFAPLQAVVQAVPAVLIQAEPAPSKVAARALPEAATKPVASRDGRFVVQLAAHDSPKMAEWAWTQAVRRHAVLGGYAPTGETHGAFHRVAAGGFATHKDAASVCAQVKRGGGSCFVRSATRQAPAQWALRYGTKLASR